MQKASHPTRTTLVKERDSDGNFLCGHLKTLQKCAVQNSAQHKRIHTRSVCVMATHTGRRDRSSGKGEALARRAARPRCLITRQPERDSDPSTGCTRRATMSEQYTSRRLSME